MKLASSLGIAGAVLVHSGVLLFGGALFLRGDADRTTTQEVELLSVTDDADEKEPEKPEEQPAEETEELETEVEQPPDTAEILRNIELSAAAAAPALEAASLSAMEQALNGQGGGGDFAEALSFSSGGRIGGMGGVGSLDAGLESAFNLTEIDQKPRATFQSAPLYPSEGRGLEGVVTVTFVVDSSGKVANTKAEKATHPAFEKPALDAVRQWKFEPAVKAGQRVGCKMRVSIRFQPSQ